MPAPLTLRERRLVIATAFVVAATRVVALARHPWDWDEILFCLSLRDYNVLAHQPHPPGFPLYVAAAKVARLFIETDFHALQAVNFLAAIAVFPVFFWLARAFRLDFATAWCAALLFAFLPNVWYFGGTGFSDVPAMVLFLAAAAALLSVGTSGTRRFFQGSLLLAAALLIRPHNALMVIYPWVAATVRLVRGGHLRAVIRAAIVAGLIVASGYGVAAATTGFGEYAHSLRAHADYVRRADSMENPERPSMLEVLRRQLDPYEAGKVSLLLNVLALTGIVFGRRSLSAEVLLTFLPSLLFGTFALSAGGFSRLSLSYIALVPLLAAEGIRVLAQLRPRLDRVVRAGLMVVILGRIIWWMMPAFEARKPTPPPIVATTWLRDHTDPDKTTILVHDSMWPWGRYYLAGRKTRRVGDDIGLQTDHDAGDEWLLRVGEVHSLNSIWFGREQDRAWNLTPLRHYYDVHVQRASDVAFFGSGWYQYEWDGTVRWRWMARSSLLLLPPISGPCELRLRFSLPVKTVGRPIRVSFSMNGAPIGSIVANKEDNEVRYVAAGRGNAPNVLRIEVSETMMPPDDRRQLGLRLWTWGWRRTQ